MRSSDREKLLNGVLSNGAYETFRGRAFQVGLRELRARRTSRFRATRAWALAASVALMFGYALIGLRKSNVNQPGAGQETDLYVRSVPLSAAEIVQTRHNDGFFVERSRAETIDLVETERAPIKELNDRELLAIFGSRPVGLVRYGDKADLVILGD
jgi:hypothetical protein